MAKQILLKRLINPTKHSGAKKNLLKRDGVVSDGDFIRDDDSSSLSDRLGQGRRRPKNRAKTAVSNLFRRISKRNSNAEEDEGYESSSEASTGSTRSTSATFLRYQNRAIWKVRRTKVTILQRLGDGSDKPLENETKPWPIFDRTYKRENQLLKKAVERESSDDEDSVSSNGDDNCPLAPPAPTSFPFGREEKVCEVELGEVILSSRASGPKESVPILLSCHLPDESVVNEVVDEQFTVDGDSSNGRFARSRKAETQSSNVDSRSVNVQESGISTSESPKKSSPVVSTIQRNTSSEIELGFPTQSLVLPTATNETKPRRVEPKPSRLAHPSPNEKGDTKLNIIPRSIPRTICYSLRSAIGDGSARQRNSHTLMEQRPLRPNGCAVDVSYWSHRGKRSYMEDRFVIEHIGSTSKNKDHAEPISLLAVFDGHGGSAASQFCSDWFSSYIRKKNDHYPHNISMAVEAAFTKIDSDFVSAGHFDGTTACAVTIVGKQVICCNAGDSRAIIVKRDGTFVALSQDHKPDRQDESKRINDLGGRVIHWGRWRVEGVLAVSRSIGDARMKPYVTAEPETVVHDIDNDDMFLVVASDGVWDTMSSDLVAKFVLVNTCKIIQKKLHVDKKLLRWIARQISKRARENGSSDNISCIVAHLKSR